jgi:hypothetical protein
MFLLSSDFNQLFLLKLDLDVCFLYINAPVVPT